MRESQSGKKSFPGGRRFLEDTPHPKAPGILGEACLPLWKMAGTLVSTHVVKLPTSRKTRTLLSEERN